MAGLKNSRQVKYGAGDLTVKEFTYEFTKISLPPTGSSPLFG